MADNQLLLAHKQKIIEYISNLAHFEHIPRDEFLKTREFQDIIEYNLYKITYHISQIIELIEPQPIIDAVKTLFNKEIINNDQLELLKYLIELRTIISDNYTLLDKNTVYLMLTRAKTDITDLAEALISS